MFLELFRKFSSIFEVILIVRYLLPNEVCWNLMYFLQSVSFIISLSIFAISCETRPISWVITVIQCFYFSAINIWIEYKFPSNIFVVSSFKVVWTLSMIGIFPYPTRNFQKPLRVRILVLVISRYLHDKRKKNSHFCTLLVILLLDIKLWSN